MARSSRELSNLEPGSSSGRAFSYGRRLWVYWGSLGLVGALDLVPGFELRAVLELSRGFGFANKSRQFVA